MGYCQGKPPATVVIKFKNGAKEEVVSGNVPVEVSVIKKKPIETEENGEDTAEGNCCNVTYILKVTYESCTLDRFGSGECEGESVTDTVEPHFTGKLLGVKQSFYNEIPNGVIAMVKDCAGVVHDVGLFNVGSAKLLGYSFGSIKRADGKPDLCDPPDEDQNKCVITVKGANGAIIYKKEDDCPIKFKVRCGNECAEGEIRCESNHYPGYCCHDCDDLARALR